MGEWESGAGAKREDGGKTPTKKRVHYLCQSALDVLGVEPRSRLITFPVKSGRTMGLEPTNGGTTNHCLNHLATLAIALPSIASRLVVDLVFFIKFFFSCPTRNSNVKKCSHSG